MRSLQGKAGFTLLEMLVASLLLGMLVTILTMVFNSSSIAWRTGKSSTAHLNALRQELMLAQSRAENILPRVNISSKAEIGLVAGPWHADGKVRRRAVSLYDNDGWFAQPSFSSLESDKKSPGVDPWLQLKGLASIDVEPEGTFIVGVLSYGPDRKLGGGDDIDTWPNEVE